MRKIASAAVASVLAGLMFVPTVASAASVSVSIGEQERYVGRQCVAHPNWRGCDDWKHNRRHWGHNDYRDWYVWNRSNVGSAAAGLFGFAVGAALFSGMARAADDSHRVYVVDDDFDDHVAACEARYRSYNAETDMFLGYDGRHHRCTL